MTHTAAAEEPTRVLIAASYQATRVGLRLALGRETICAEAGDAPAALAAARRDRPDVCLLDIEPSGELIRVAGEIAADLPDAAVIVLTPRVDRDEFLAVMRAGAAGYLPETVDPGRLADVVRGVRRGEAAVPRGLVRHLVDELRDGGDEPSGARFTAREEQVLELARRQLPTREIAARLGISQVTARRHLGRAGRKLGVRSQAELRRLLR